LRVALRWKEAYDMSLAPRVLMASCHEKALEYVSMDALKVYALPNV
jgi:uncharacterized protein